MSKTRASCFIRGSKHLETIKAVGLRPRAFISFSVFGTPDETLALVFDTLHQNCVETETNGRPTRSKVDCTGLKR